MPRDASNPLLLTPGPVSISLSTKMVMLKDRASSGAEFQADLKFARDYMVGLVSGQGAYTAIPLPGSATYSNEAVISTLVPPGGKLLIHTNGVYGDRLIAMCAHTGKAYSAIRTPPFMPATSAQFEAAIQADPAVTHVIVVLCETSTGVLNPRGALARICCRPRKPLLVAALSSSPASALLPTRSRLL